LKDRVEFQYGYSVRVNDEKSGEYPVFGSNGITGYIDSYKVKGPGVIIGRKGSVGAIRFSDKNFTPTDTAYYLSIKDKTKDDIKFWYYYLQLLGLEKLNTHSSVPGLSREIAYFVNVNPPDISTQQKIAAVLSALDAKIELNQRINAELESMAKTLYDYWFVQFDFPNEKGKPYKSAGGKMVWNEELKREIPLGWENSTLSDLGTITGGSTPSREVAEYFTSNGMAWITPKDLSLNSGNKFITKGELDVSEKGIKAASLTIMPKGTILLSSRAPIGYMAIAREEVTTNQGFKSFVPDKGYSIPFIYYTVKNAIPTIINHSTGSTFKEASASVLKSISVCLPPVSITEKFKETVDAVFERQNKLELESQTLTELRDWLLPLLMNGQVKVG
jgi:type I restriction enzyme S subunit